MAFRSGETLVGEACKSFKCVITKPVEQKLTRNPLSNGFVHVDFFVKSIYHFEKRFACFLCMTCCEESFAQALLIRDTKVLKFPP